MEKLIDEKRARTLYKAGYDFLVEKKQADEEYLKAQLKAEKKKTLNEIYFRICESAKTKERVDTMINAGIGEVKALSRILDEFNPAKVTAKFKPGDNLKLLGVFKKEFPKLEKVNEEQRGIWPQFSHSIIYGARFLSEFKNANDFYSWADSFPKDEMSLPALPLMISSQVKGIGFALACDFLKDIGFSNYGKPDSQIKSQFEAFGLLIKNEYHEDIKALRLISEIAQACGATAYAVDKVFWMIGSGHYSERTSKKPDKKSKEEFIKLMRGKI
jgi:hypothetical protein